MNHRKNWFKYFFLCVFLSGDSLCILAVDYSKALSGNTASFVRNNGQQENNILFKTDYNGQSIRFLSSNEISVAVLRNKVPNDSSLINPAAERNLECLVWNYQFLNANKTTIFSEEGKPNNIRHFKGSAEPMEEKIVDDIVYKNLYNHIDLHYYYSSGNLKYDFIVGANANTDEIKISLKGIKNIRLSETGNLIITHAWGEVEEIAPYAYQNKNENRVEVSCSYKIIDNTTFAFTVGKYDKTKELIIDPLTLQWSTYLGGAAGAGQISDIHVGQNGDVYVTGQYTTTYPTTPGVYNLSNSGATDAYIAKLSANGSTLLYATYIGGSGDDWTNGIDVNAAGEVFIMGYTRSANYPTTTGSFQATFQGGASDLFITKFSATASTLL